MIGAASGIVRLYALADLVLMAARLLSPSTADEGDVPIADEDVDALADATGVSDPQELAATLVASLAMNRAVDPVTWHGEHTRLFEGGVTCPINETAFVRRDKGQIIADVCAFYEAFGFEPRWGSGEKPDHLVAELEFVAVMLVLLAGARASTRVPADAAAVTEDALRSFMLEHLGEWLPLFCVRLAAVTALPLFACHAATLAAAWDAVADAFDLPRLDALASSLDAAAAPPDSDLDETPYECGLVEPDDAPFVPLTRGGA